MLAYPACDLSMRAGESLSLDLENIPDREARKLVAALQALQGTTSRPLAGEFRLRRVLPAHVGLGTTTAMVMHLLQEVLTFNGVEISQEELAALSGRGRTSGIGVSGGTGLVIDLGVAQPGSQVPHEPSMVNAGRPPALTLPSWPMPDWPVALWFTDMSPTFSADQELAFYRHLTPTRVEESRVQIAAVYHGILPAALEGDYHAFAKALAELQSTGFKRLEIAAQPESVRKQLEALREDGFAAGLTSMGPTVFAFGRSLDHLGRAPEIDHAVFPISILRSDPHRVT